MKSEILCNGRSNFKPVKSNAKEANLRQESLTDGEWETESDQSDSESGYEYIEEEGFQENSQSMYQRASELIITQRVLPKSWFSRTPSVEMEIKVLSQIVDKLLQTYEGYFNNVVQKEPWCEQRGVSDFRKITEEVLNSDDDQANWTRIAMLLALATRVSQHFYRKGSKRESVQRFSKAVGWCIEARVNSWENRGDRWEKLRVEAASKSGKGLVPLFEAGAVIFSFLAVIVPFTMTTPVFLSKLKS